jgi:hypothetical protein
MPPPTELGLPLLLVTTFSSLKNRASPYSS